MRISKIRMVIAVMAAATLLGGCGDTPYTLTENEENIIVNYSAHVIAKYNTLQKDGLVYVDIDKPETVETPETEVPENTESDIGEIHPQSGTATDESITADTQEALEMISLGEIFGESDLSMEVTGADIADNYMEDVYYVIDPNPGKKYLVLEIAISNTGESDKEVDILAAAPTFTITLSDGTTAKSELTILSDDFSTYQGTVAAGAVRQTVLLFQVPDTITEPGDFSLTATVNDTGYQISL